MAATRQHSGTSGALRTMRENVLGLTVVLATARSQSATSRRSRKPLAARPTRIVRRSEGARRHPPTSLGASTQQLRSHGGCGVFVRFDRSAVDTPSSRRSTRHPPGRAHRSARLLTDGFGEQVLQAYLSGQTRCFVEFHGTDAGVRNRLKWCRRSPRNTAVRFKGQPERIKHCAVDGAPHVTYATRRWRLAVIWATRCLRADLKADRMHHETRSPERAS